MIEIGELWTILVPYYDIQKADMAFKTRPALILAKADANDYAVLPVSSVTRKQNLHPVFDIEINPSRYPKTNLNHTSYVRVHKRTIVHASQMNRKIGDLKTVYEDLFLEILNAHEKHNKDIIEQALS